MTAVQRLAANLKKRRGNLSQEAFARKIGISRATLNRLESCSQNTTIKTLQQIAKALRCEITDLFARPPE